MEAVQEQELDTLSSLEERITRAVQAIVDLRSQNRQLQEQLGITQLDLETTRSARGEAETLAHQVQRENGDLEDRLRTASEELTQLREERRQVRERIEKLLGQLDLLSST